MWTYVLVFAVQMSENNEYVAFGQSCESLNSAIYGNVERRGCRRRRQDRTAQQSYSQLITTTSPNTTV